MAIDIEGVRVLDEADVYEMVLLYGDKMAHPQLEIPILDTARACLSTAEVEYVRAAMGSALAVPPAFLDPVHEQRKERISELLKGASDAEREAIDVALRLQELQELDDRGDPFKKQRDRRALRAFRYGEAWCEPSERRRVEYSQMVLRGWEYRHAVSCTRSNKNNCCPYHALRARSVDGTQNQPRPLAAWSLVKAALDVQYARTPTPSWNICWTMFDYLFPPLPGELHG